MADVLIDDVELTRLKHTRCAYDILVHQLLTTLVDGTRHTPVHREQVVHGIILGMAKAAGELS